MVNQQLRDYISEQIHLGVTTEAVKAALLESGWAEADVTEAMQLEAGGAPATPATPAAQVVQQAVAQPTVVVAKPVQSATPATVDIVQPKITVTATKSVSPTQISASSLGSSAKPVTLAVSEKPARKSHIGAIVMFIFFIGASTAAAFFYTQMSTLRDQVDAASAQGGAVDGKVTGLTKERDTLSSKVVALTADNKDLLSNLSLFVADEGASGDQSIVLSGTLMPLNAKGMYTLKTSHGALVTIKNSKDSAVEKVLKPLISATMQIAGTHVAGSADITVLTVNGASVQAPATVTSSTPAGTGTSTASSSIPKP